MDSSFIFYSLFIFLMPLLLSLENARKFYDALRLGKLDEVKQMLDENDELLKYRFTMVEENAVQVAVVAGQEEIVSELLDRVIDLKLLKKKNNYGETALTLAAAGGKLCIVEMLVEKCEELLDVPNSQGYIPAVVAALYGHMDIVGYLYPLIVFSRVEKKEEDQSLSTDNKESNQANEKYPINYDQLNQDIFKVCRVSMKTELHGYEQNYNFKLESEGLEADDEATYYGYSSKHNKFMIFKACIAAGAYDIALRAFKLCQNQCIEEMKKEKGTTLYPLVFADLAKEKRNRLLAWVYDRISSGLPQWASAYLTAPSMCGKKCMNNHSKDARVLLRAIAEELFHLNNHHNKAIVLGRPMLMAILQEKVDFVEVVTEGCPDMLWFEINGLTLFAHAISKGHEKIYRFAYKRPEMGHLASLIPDRDGNTLLHQAAKLSPSSSTQFLGPALQMQIELQLFTEMEKKVPMCKGILNKNDKTPIDLFRDEHKKLKSEARRWLKDVATSCSLVATLIVTIMFAAASTPPGSNKEGAGTLTNLQSKYVTAYTISDAFSMFFSCTSAMIFLGIHTSLFRDEDFLIKLPLALMFGLLTLFLSIATMLVAFGIALVIMLRLRFVWISIPLLMIGGIPVSIYAILHVRIFIRVLRLTFPSRPNWETIRVWGRRKNKKDF